MPTPLPITDRPVRLAVVGLGQIAELCLPPYAGHADVEVVGLCDARPERLDRWATVFPGATRTTSLDELLALDADVVDVLVPTPAHAEVVERVLAAGFHVQVQKPLARSLEEADAMLAAAARHGASLRVMEDYVCFPPLVQLRDLVHADAVGPPQALHMKIVATARGGWEVDPASYEWQFAQAADGHGILTFDHAWHQIAVAHWLFGPIERVFGWVRRTPIGPPDQPDIVLDVPATFVWEHAGGVRGVLDIVLAADMYFRSDHYADDERIEVTGTRGYVRCNRISGRGVQEPSVVLYQEGEVRAFHALPDEPRDAFAASAANGIAALRGEAEPLFDAATSRRILHELLTALESSRLGLPLDVTDT